MTIEVNGAPATPEQLSAIRQSLGAAGQEILGALRDHTVLKVAAIDATAYPTIAAIDAVYGGQLAAGGAAIAFDGYPGGAAVVAIEQDGGAGTPVTHAVLRSYHSGLTVVANDDSKQRTWKGTAWEIESVKPDELDTRAPAYLTAPLGITSAWGPNDAPIYLSAGQSNSYGHGATMAVADRITTALVNVKTLKTGPHKNTAFTDVTWDGLTSLGECNLGGTNTDHLYNTANEFARLWQAHITEGNALGLPDLYVILTGTGGQGMYPGSPIDAWSFTRSASDVNSLFPRYMKTLRLAIANLRAAGKNPRIIVQNWNQWEAEADAQANTSTLFGKEYAAMHFNRLIQSIRDATGCPELRFDFYYPQATTYPTANMLAVRQALESVVAMDPVRLGFNDVRNSPSYTGVSPGFGIFQADNVHYNSVTQKWFAAQQFARVAAGDKGVPAGMWPHGTRPLSQVESDITALQASVASVAATSAPTSWRAQSFTVGTNIETAPGLSFDVGASSFTFNVTRTDGVKAITATKTADPYGFMRSTAFISDSMSGELVADVQSGSYPLWLGAAFRVSTQGVVGGGFQGVPYSYVSCNFDQGGAFNVWVLWNSTLDIARDRRLNVPAASFARALPTGAFKLRIRLVALKVFVQYSTDGATWLDVLTSDNTTAGTAGKTFTFDAGHASLTGVQTNGGVAGFIMSLGANSLRTSGVFNSLEFNPLP